MKQIEHTKNKVTKFFTNKTKSGDKMSNLRSNRRKSKKKRADERGACANPSHHNALPAVEALFSTPSTWKVSKK